MANPPITIGPFATVPAPGSPIRSNWPQEISTVVAALAAAPRYSVVPYTSTALGAGYNAITIGTITDTNGLLVAVPPYDVRLTRDAVVGGVLQLTVSGTGAAGTRVRVSSGTMEHATSAWWDLASGTQILTLTWMHWLTNNALIRVTALRPTGTASVTDGKLSLFELRTIPPDPVP